MFPISEITKKLNNARIDNIGSIDSGKALLYLYRRFGFTNCGSDAYKEVCDYVIPTNHPEIDVVIHIGARRAFLSFTTTREVHDHYLQDQFNSHNELTDFMEEVHQAIEDCLRDLLRPVWVRDVPINLLGEVSDEEDDAVERSPMAGYGVPAYCYHDPNLFIDFVAWVREQGDGYFAAGVRKMMTLVED